MACDEGPQITMRITPINAKKEPLTLEQLGYLPTQIAMLMRAMRSEGGAIVLSGSLTRANRQRYRHYSVEFQARAK